MLLLSKITFSNRRYILSSILFFFVLLIHTVNAQPKITFQKSEHDFGRVANLSYPPIAFQFTNTGSEDLAILKVNREPNIMVKFPRKYIKPGESAQVFILPDLNTLGTFNKKITLITNASNSEYQLTLTGEVIAIQECFPNPDNWNIREIHVTDAVTKLPLNDVQANLIHNDRYQINGSTDKKGIWTGEMKIGQYNFNLAKAGYQPLQKTQYIGRSVPIIFFEMHPIDQPPIEPDPIELENIQKSIEEPINIPQNPNQLSRTEYGANNLVLLIDVSLSMRTGKKLDLLKQSINNLIDVLRDIDNVSLISYAESPKILIQGIPGNQKTTLTNQINGLEAKGITRGVKGLHKAYELAQQKKVLQGNNQIILATDGQFTGGSINPDEIRQFIREQAMDGVTLSIIGFGVDQEAKSFMAGMARAGKGKYIHVNTKDDISKTLIDEIKENSRIKK